MKKFDSTHVGVLYTCEGITTTQLPDGTMQYFYIFKCTDELALTFENSLVRPKHYTLKMSLSYSQPLLNEGDMVSITFEQFYKQHRHKAPTIWWQPVGYASYTPRTGGSNAVNP